MTPRTIDLHIINFFKRAFEPMARIGLFIVFFWFGALKVLGLSPASGIVEELLRTTIPFMEPALFVVLFGVFECLIGVLFLIKGLERVVLPLLFVHLITTLGPLVFLPSSTWSGFLTPTLEGQYIIKNVVIVAAAMGIAAHVHPLKR